MKERHRERAIEMDERDAFKMCKRKKKYKSGKAGKYASFFGQRKYHCPLCGHWHLTKKGVNRG